MSEFAHIRRRSVVSIAALLLPLAALAACGSGQDEEMAARLAAAEEGRLDALRGKAAAEKAAAAARASLNASVDADEEAEEEPKTEEEELRKLAEDDPDSIELTPIDAGEATSGA